MSSLIVTLRVMESPSSPMGFGSSAVTTGRAVEWNKEGEKGEGERTGEGKGGEGRGGRGRRREREGVGEGASGRVRGWEKKGGREGGKRIKVEWEEGSREQRRESRRK